MQNIHQEYNKSERNSSSDRQFFTLQTQQMQSCDRKSKAVQVDHVEEQYVTRRNTFSGRNPLYIEEMERPVFVNNYYAGNNPQQMFHEIGQKDSKKNNYSNFCLYHVQQDGTKTQQGVTIFT